MKAYPFLQLEWLFSIEKINGNPTEILFREDFMELLKFYSQPFNPYMIGNPVELIERGEEPEHIRCKNQDEWREAQKNVLFVGFDEVIEIPTATIFKSERYNIRITHKSDNVSSRGIVLNNADGDILLGISTNIFNYPLTLDEFISYADRCGIELEWSEAVIKKYF
jgi:hypothetical protein